MRTQKSIVAALFVVCGMAMAAGSANASVWISDPNLLAGQEVILNWGINPQYATDLDGTAALFDAGNPVQQMVVRGFNASVDTIRLWADTYGEVPLQVSIWSSTNANSSLTGADLSATGDTAAHFETLLAGGSTPATLGVGAFTTGANPGWAQAGYIDFAVNAPAGTQSLYLNFYGGNSRNGNTGGAAVVEVQAFGTITTPEPSTFALLSCGLIGLLCYAWRKRRQ